MEWTQDIAQQEKHKFDGFWPLDLELSAARSLEYIPLAGDSLHVLELTGRVEVRFNTPNSAPLRLDPLNEVRAIKTVFTGVYLSNTAQSGARMRLAAGVNFDLDRQPGAAPTGMTITNVAMTGAVEAWPVPVGTVSLGLQPLGGDVEVLSDALGDPWTIRDGEKEAINANLGGRTIYFEGAVGTTLQIRVLRR